MELTEGRVNPIHPRVFLKDIIPEKEGPLRIHSSSHK